MLNHQKYTQRFNVQKQYFSAVALLCLAAASAPAYAQSRTCIIDEMSWQVRCGLLSDEQGNRIADRPVVVPMPLPAPVFVPAQPSFNNDRSGGYVPGKPFDVRDPRHSREDRMAFEQHRMQVQEQVNGLFLETLGRDADISTLRRVAGQVMEGRAMSDVRIELATSTEARTAINQIYRDVLRRDADPSGLNAQMAGLRGGLTLAQIRQAIAESPEGRSRR